MMEIFHMSPEIMRRSRKMREVRKYKKSSSPRLRWTPQLHDLFIQCVEHLGGRNKATPKRIVQMMGIKGLKISHVKSHLQMHRNMKEHPSLHVMMPDFNLSSPLLREHAHNSSKQNESGSQNGENIHYYDYQEAEGSLSSGMTKEEEEDECENERNFCPNKDDDHQNYSQFNNASSSFFERNFWPDKDDDHQNYSQFNNASSSFFDSTSENSSRINLDLSLS
ncbi:putative Myb family transcription factor At1g14600 [Lycium barbarum]|uniref:putative Myb family transcription factor At1g14600 n=1 Tax=Lycium barbarum TaxID=112863 RepID=UPI00293F37AE|nr:putative Myb family transcription factor At1g14600 [Lycium barbarum]